LLLRGYRLAAAFLAGAALAVGGVVVQGLFRNPLASPSVLGTTAGATLGGQLALLGYGLVGLGAGVVVPEMILPIGCFAGALGALAILLLFLRVTEDLLALLLTGFVLSALFLSLSAFAISVAQERWELGRAVVAFSLGSVSGTGPRQLLFATPLVLAGAIACWVWGRPLDLLLSGEEEARSLGADVVQIRWWSATWVSILVAGAVSVGGNVGFVGLVVPHLMRPFAGTRHRRLIPASAIAGGLFLVTCDVVARVVPSTSEIPLGVVTGIIGAPLFLVLLIRLRKEHAYA
jgi:iron complex transport system permease protein